MAKQMHLYITFHLNKSTLIYLNTVAHVLIHVLVAVHYAVKQGDTSPVKTLLDSLTPEQQLQFLSTKDEDGKAAVQLAPADMRKHIEKMLMHYMREADFEVNYGKLALFSHLAGLVGTRDDIRKPFHFAFSN